MLFLSFFSVIQITELSYKISVSGKHAFPKIHFQWSGKNNWNTFYSFLQIKKKKINLLDTIRDHIIRANKEKKLDWDIFPYIFSEWKVFFSDDYRKISENNYN